jgi:TonB family protein
MKLALFFAALIAVLIPASAQQPAETVYELYDVEKPPAFPGGDRARSQYLARQINYPAEARRNGEEGFVVLDFVVGADGKLRNVVIIRGVSRSIDAEALRIVRTMPAWAPAERQGVPVAVRYSLPVQFDLH